MDATNNSPAARQAHIFLLGAGGHAKVVLESLMTMRPRSMITILDDDPSKKGQLLLGRPVIGDRSLLYSAADDSVTVPAIGSNAVRFEFIAWATNHNLPLLAVRDPSSVVSSSAVLSPGAYVAPNATVNACAHIGAGAIINTGASVDHDCHVEAGAHVAPGARLCGGVEIGERTLIGAGAIIVPGIKIGADALIGAGSVVVRDLADHARVAGNPARPLRVSA